MKGLSLIEVLLVTMVIMILFALILPFGLDFYKSQQLETHTQGILQTLRRAQIKAMATEGDSSFGIYITNDNYTLFKGISYQNRDPQYDEVFDLPTVITINDQPKEFVFSKFEGKPSLIGNIVLNSNDESRIISVNKFGTISLLIPAVSPSHPYLAQLHYRWRNDDGIE
ncbi:MAG TPA: hypothetical protein ENI19_03075 [Candidatus Nealsonbacteria bacterium]|uniref:General secretion pathway GspH domain-containing protein n=1 Tax=marine sediment metagenome TaxID=412755 RepID=A0A0F9XIQ0_9ZZZZ|nr:hypothetical protein [Candidatus Nealsonbacteria bacterium]HEB46662.1 hypothetical protein [Candidatus Nealsonbacteria bacterium]